MGRNRKSENRDGGAKAVDSILVKYFSRLIVALTVILVFLTLVQCSIKKPESPEWTTNFVLPVINKTYDMPELISRLDQDGVAMDSQGNITFTISEKLDTLTLSSSYLTTPNLSYSFGQKLDTVSISSPTIAPVFVDLATITGISASTPEDTLTIGQRSFDINNALPNASNNTSATVSAGTANMHFHNFISAAITMVSPLEIVIQPSKVNTDIDNTAINQQELDVVTDHVVEARFIYNITSHLPIGAQIDIYFGPDSATLISNLQLLVNALQLPAAPFGAGGIVTDTLSTGFQEVFLDSLDLKILQNDTLFFCSALNLAGTGGQMVKLTANDYLSISSRIEANYRFDGNF